jgi:hypothetical protein
MASRGLVATMATLAPFGAGAFLYRFGLWLGQNLRPWSLTWLSQPGVAQTGVGLARLRAARPSASRAQAFEHVAALPVPQ